MSQTLSRELRQKFESVLKQNAVFCSDGLENEAHYKELYETLAEQLSVAALEVRAFSRAKLPAGSDIAFLMATGASAEEIAENNARTLTENEVRDYYESCMGYNPLNWGGDEDLAKLLKFLLTKTKDEIKTFSEWSKRPFSTFDPVKAKRYPLEVIEFWPIAVQQVEEERPEYQKFTPPEGDFVPNPYTRKK